MKEFPKPEKSNTGWPWTVPEAWKQRRGRESSGLPLVSLVTPSLNQRPFLEETIRSVLLQDYPNMEYIIIDGKSTDGSLSIIKKYQQHLSFWVSEPDQGHAHAINKGWRRAKGEFISWLNSDDFLYPHSLRVTVEALVNNPDMHICYGDVVRVDERSQPCDRDFRGGPFDLKDMLAEWKNPVPQPGFLLRRSVLDRIGFLDPSYAFAFDFEYWMRMAANGFKGRHLSQRLAGFRLHKETKSSTQQETRIQNRFDLYDQYFRSEAISPEFKKAYRQKSKKKLYLNAADIYFQSKEPEKLRATALRGLQEYQWNVPAYGYVFLSLLGKKGMKAAQMLYRLVKGIFLRDQPLRADLK